MDSKLPSAALSKPVCSCIRLFAGRQWGRNRSNEAFIYPIALSERVCYASSIHIGESPEPNHVVKYSGISLTATTFVTSSASDFDQFVLILGR